MEDGKWKMQGLNRAKASIADQIKHQTRIRREGVGNILDTYYGIKRNNC